MTLEGLLTKIQFGHGGHILEGWQNFEQHEADITKPLNFKEESVHYILIEHVLEHVTPQQGYSFLVEAYRILKPTGVIRVIVPDITKVWRECDDGYIGLLKEGLKTWYPVIGRDAPAEPTKRDAIEHLVFCHGHQALWTQDLLATVMKAIGYKEQPCEYGKTRHEELKGVDSHWRYIGLENCKLESVVVEGQK